MGRGRQAKHGAPPSRSRRALSALVTVLVVAVGAAAIGIFVLNRPSGATADGDTELTAQVNLGLAAPTGVPTGPESVDPASGLGPKMLATPAGPRFPSDTPVFLLGDSLAVGIADLLTTAEPNRSVTVDALEGRSATTQDQLLMYSAATTPPIWVVSLGTNDAPEEFPAAARELITLAGPSRCVLWFDVHRASTQDQINATLGRLAQLHPNLHLLQWNDLANANPLWFGSDGIHPAQEGYVSRTTLAADGLAGFCTAEQ
jgi:lysophospholipase L1-like esterase